MNGAGLTEVAVYRRRIGASLERVWENVLDWEHLPWVHSSSFASIKALEADRAGWRAEVEIVLGDETVSAEVDLRTERDRGRYLTATADGFGAGTEIWTELEPAGPKETDIEVRFRVPDVPSSEAEAVGEIYRELYSRLWDEDERMMQHRAAMLARLGERRASAEQRDLGSLEQVLTRVPFVVDIAGLPYRVVLLEGQVQAYSAVCPHVLGPLDSVEVCDGRVRCPWHGYEFDVRTGRSCDGRNLRLGSKPMVSIFDGRVLLSVGDDTSSRR